ncbi:MAG: hypothetical protein EOT05_04200 [Candidatus Microsaccharimonas sossegonensis]|uniref:NAD(P)-binding domain-containing protein n=1 Tax=Candidatus Microsaccharimonas sossegonensis TaxID=2506948 RepID=A0A4Q0AI91_9BACT|nr:MAG: hypothetical protein EOT05_04200 [Candidatus Microsaccharimonas sossegonensis]
MNIAIISANGRLGLELVKVALAAGHHVRAGTRGLSHFKDSLYLTAIPCDATNYYEVKALLKGQDIVFSCIGHVPNSAKDVQTQATKVIVRVMKELGITRFITLTGTGVRLAGDHITLFDRFLNFGVEMLDRPRIIDGRNHVQVLRESELEWTVIRVLKLEFENNRPFTLLPHGPTLPYVSRKVAARAMLQVAENHSFIRQLPIIGR